MRILALLLILSLAGVYCAPLLAAGKKISDDQISDQVSVKLATDSRVKGGGFDIVVKDGVVTLRGKVHDEKQKDRATSLAKKVKGVVKVDNQLVIAP